MGGFNNMLAGAQERFSRGESSFYSQLQQNQTRQITLDQIMSLVASLARQAQGNQGIGTGLPGSPVSAAAPAVQNAAPQAAPVQLAPQDPYLQFNKNINPMDLGAINQQQANRNQVYSQFLTNVQKILGQNLNVQQSPANSSYLQPITATYNNKPLTLYHYDMFQGDAQKAAAWLSDGAIPGTSTPTQGAAPMSAAPTTSSISRVGLPAGRGFGSLSPGSRTTR